MRARELRPLREAAKAIGVDLRDRLVDLMELGRDPDTGAIERRWQLLRGPDGVCPLLDQETNLCRVYDARPKACRIFPTRPVRGCLLEPGGPTDPAL